MDNAQRLRDRGLSQRALMALTVIAEGCREPSREGHVARARIAAVLGATERTATRALQELVQAGIVVVVEGPRRRARSFDPVTGETVEKGVATLYRIELLKSLSEAQESDESPDSEDTRASSQSEAGTTNLMEPGDKSEFLGRLPDVPLPLENPVSDSRGSRAQAGALAGGAPSRYCFEHPDGTAKPCGACASAREQREAWTRRRANEVAAAQAAARLTAADARRRRIAACVMCDSSGYRMGGICSHDLSQDEVNRRGAARVRAVLARQQVRVSPSTVATVR